MYVFEIYSNIRLCPQIHIFKNNDGKNVHRKSYLSYSFQLWRLRVVCDDAFLSSGDIELFM